MKEIKKVMITMQILVDDLEIIKKAAKASYNKKKHRKDYGVSAYMKESALNRAKRVLK